MFLQNLFSELNQSHIRYILVGGLAVNLHGIPRATFDIDIIIALDNTNIDRFWSLMQKSNMTPLQPVTLEQLQDPGIRQSWVTDKNLTDLTFCQNNPPHMEIDLLLHSFDLSFEAMYQNAVIFEDKGIVLRTASIETLISLKKHSGRDQDLQDIRFLEQLR